MNKTLLLLFLSIFILESGNSEELVLEGTYQGENLFVKNPFASSGVGFCVYEVTVNGLLTTDEINSSSFEIDFAVFQFAIGDPISISIKYKEDCQPIVMNPEGVESRATFQIVDIKVDGNKLYWSTSGESGELPFFAEQFRWNKWVRVGEVLGKGSRNENAYSVPLRFHSGVNKFRVRQIDYTSKSKYSQVVEVNSNLPEVSFTPSRVDVELAFTAETMYEIYDEYGGIVFKGYGSRINVQGLTKGRYYLNYDNKMGQFFKK